MSKTEKNHIQGHGVKHPINTVATDSARDCPIGSNPIAPETLSDKRVIQWITLDSQEIGIYYEKDVSEKLQEIIKLVELHEDCKDEHKGTCLFAIIQGIKELAGEKLFGVKE